MNKVKVTSAYGGKWRSYCVVYEAMWNMNISIYVGNTQKHPQKDIGTKPPICVSKGALR